MKLRTKYMVVFFSSTVITLLVVGLSIFGFYRLNKTTNYLVTVNSRILEQANSYEIELAKSRRAEKEFFIFPDKPEKQLGYVTNLEESMEKIIGHLDELRDLFALERQKKMLYLVIQAKKVVLENKEEWAKVVVKFQETKSYDTVNKAEYGEFKKRTHTLEEIATDLSKYGYTEVEKGRKDIEAIQKQTQIIIKIISVFAVLWGIIVPLVFSKRMTSYILYLIDIANDISKGKTDKEIKIERTDELGDLAQSIKRMQTSTRIMLKKYAKK